MKKLRKPRVTSIGVQPLVTPSSGYYLVNLFDKKGKMIPSSVQCAYNADYYELEEVFQMSRAAL